MADKARYIKQGMAGSRCGRERSEKTAVLKNDSKKRRRRQAKRECQEIIRPGRVY